MLIVVTLANSPGKFITFSATLAIEKSSLEVTVNMFRASQMGISQEQLLQFLQYWVLWMDMYLFS